MDDLKAIWAQNPPVEKDLSEELKSARARRVSRSAAVLRNRLWLEAAAVALLSIGIIWAWQTGVVFRSRSVLWLLAAVAASVLPVFWRLGRAIGGLSRPDLSQNVVENLRTSVAAVRRELMVYRWSVYAFSVVMGLFLLAFPFVFWKKAALLGFVLLNAFLAKWWVRLLYGRELSKLEKELEDWTTDD